MSSKRLSTVEFGGIEEQWSAMDRRLRMRLVSERFEKPAWNLRMSMRPLRVFAALLLLTIGIYQLKPPVPAGPLNERPARSTDCFSS